MEGSQRPVLSPSESSSLRRRAEKSPDQYFDVPSSLTWDFKQTWVWTRNHLMSLVILIADVLWPTASYGKVCWQPWSLLCWWRLSLTGWRLSLLGHFLFMGALPLKGQNDGGTDLPWLTPRSFLGASPKKKFIYFCSKREFWQPSNAPNRALLCKMFIFEGCLVPCWHNSGPNYYETLLRGQKFRPRQRSADLSKC